MKLPTISPQNVHRLKGLKSKLKLYNHLIILKSKICKLNYHLSDVSKIQFKIFFQRCLKVMSYSKNWILCPSCEIRHTSPIPPSLLQPITMIPMRPPTTTNVWNVSVHNTARSPPCKHKVCFIFNDHVLFSCCLIHASVCLFKVMLCFFSQKVYL